MTSKMQEILLISENNVRANTNISSNVQSKYLISTIREAQLDLEEIIGSRLYNKIVKLVKYDLIDEEKFEPYKILLDKCQLYLSYNTLTKLLVVSNFHIDNFGVSQSKDDNLENVSLSDTLKLEAYYQNKVDEFTKRIQRFLIANHTDYTELCKAELDEIHSNLYSSSSTSIWLGGARGKYYYSHHCCCGGNGNSTSHSGTVIETKYIIENVQYPHTVEYNVTSATINYTGLTISIYDDGFIEETDRETSAKTVTFQQNQSSEAVLIEGIEFWKDVEIDYEIVQEGKPTSSAFTITNKIIPTEVPYSATSFTIEMSGITVYTHKDGTKTSGDVETHSDVITFSQNATSSDVHITGTTEEGKWQTSYDVIQKPNPKYVVSTTYSISNTDYPSSVVWSATSVNVLYTGQTKTTYLDGTSVSVNSAMTKTVTLIPNTSYTEDNEVVGSVIWQNTGFTYTITQLHREQEPQCDTIVYYSDGTSSAYRLNEIPEKWVSGNTDITRVEIGNCVTSIGEWAFYWCSEITSITIPNSVTSIGKSAFYGCFKLSSINIPSGVTVIDEWVFCSDYALKTINFPDGLTSINTKAFSSCSGLTSINIPDSVTSIGYGAFNGCDVLTTATLGSCVTSIGNLAFKNCSSLTSINIPSGVTVINTSTFDRCSGLTSVTIPKNVTSIDEYAFNGCSGLTSINIPSNVTYLGRAVFSNCTSLTSVTIPNSVSSIGSDAFHSCTSLTEVTIGNGINNIYNGTFNNCTHLSTINYSGTISQWNSINKEDWHYAVPATVVHCTDGDINI